MFGLVTYLGMENKDNCINGDKVNWRIEKGKDIITSSRSYSVKFNVSIIKSGIWIKIMAKILVYY